MSRDFWKTWPHKSGRLFFPLPARRNLHTLEEGKDEKSPLFSDARSWWCRRTASEKNERAIYFTICQLLKATSGIQTHNILRSLQIILCLTCILMSRRAWTRGVLAGDACAPCRNRLADIWTKAFSLTGELVAVARCESSVSAAICCHNIRVT